MASQSSQNCASVDDTFGPYAGEQCRGGFDFTLLFGEVFLSIVPLALILGIAPFRIVYLWRKQTKVSRSSLLYTKLVCSHLLSSIQCRKLTAVRQMSWLLLVAFDTALLVIWATRRTPKHRAEVPSAAISFVGALVLVLLSFYEHLRSIRPSFQLNVYLFFTVLFDIQRSRSYGLDADLGLVSSVFSSRVAVKVLLAVVEARGKRHLLLPEFTNCPPEATSGVYKRASFWWLNELFRKGFSNSLAVDDLFHLDKHLQADYLQHTLGSAWDRSKSSFPFSVINNSTDAVNN